VLVLIEVHFMLVNTCGGDLAESCASKSSKRRKSCYFPRDPDLLRAVLLEQKDKDAVCRAIGVDRDYLRVLLHRAKDKFRSLHASLSEPKEETQDRGEDPAHSSPNEK
jgi:hypothetical protein